jgi:hypothetical protein
VHCSAQRQPATVEQEDDRHEGEGADWRAGSRLIAGEGVVKMSKGAWPYAWLSGWGRARGAGVEERDGA